MLYLKFEIVIAENILLAEKDNLWQTDNAYVLRKRSQK